MCKRFLLHSPPVSSNMVMIAVLHFGVYRTGGCYTNGVLTISYSLSSVAEELIMSLYCSGKTKNVVVKSCCVTNLAELS